jgi:hypothetical protein
MMLAHLILAQVVATKAPVWLEPFIIGLVVGIVLSIGVRKLYSRF